MTSTDGAADDAETGGRLDDDELLTIKQVAALMKVGERAVRRRISVGDLTAVRNGDLRVSRRAYRDYIATHSATPAVAPAGVAEGNDR